MHSLSRIPPVNSSIQLTATQPRADLAPVAASWRQGRRCTTCGAVAAGHHRACIVKRSQPPAVVHTSHGASVDPVSGNAAMLPQQITTPQEFWNDHVAARKPVSLQNAGSWLRNRARRRHRYLLSRGGGPTGGAAPVPGPAAGLLAAGSIRGAPTGHHPPARTMDRRAPHQQGGEATSQPTPLCLAAARGVVWPEHRYH